MEADAGNLRATLVLEDGSVFHGKGFGYPRRLVGEVVFNTGMVGYTEALTDPSYRGQTLCFTHPLIGNYGVPEYSLKDHFNLPTYFESDMIQVSGMIVHELCQRPSHWSSARTLHEWLCSEKIPGIWGIDTRQLTAKLRERGVMMGVLEVSEERIDVNELQQELEKYPNYGETDFVKEVSVKKPVAYGGEGSCVVLIDCGVKYSIIRNLLMKGVRVIRVPYDTSVEKILYYNPIGVVLTNGPGDPKMCEKTISVTRELVETGVPVLGICLGIQMLALSLNGDTFKLKYGHRGANKPCVDLETQRSYVTSQNHGYAVNPDSLEETGLKIWFINADDKTVEGVKHESKPCMAVQFHPEGAPGPHDTGFVFEMFLKMMEKFRASKLVEVVRDA